MVFNFALDRLTSFQVVVPDVKEKFNYYYEPTEQLHKFDVVKVFLVRDDSKKIVIEEIVDEIVGSLYIALKKVMHNKEQLPDTIKPGNVGYELNKALKSPHAERAESFWVWSSTEGYQTLLYSLGDVIYIEIAITYPWLFRDVKPGEDYFTFEKFMENYRPYFFKEIPREVAASWMQECKEILEGVDSTFLLEDWK